MAQLLQGKVAVVTGASRGIGKGVALSLGEAGATVYVTGRSGNGHAITVALTGTVDETAQEVTAMGGQGIAVRCDHRNDDETQALFERVKSEQGRLDILVNSAWMGYEGLHNDTDPLGQPFWERRLSFWDDNLFGVRSAYMVSVFATRMMLAQKHGLIVNISHYIGSNYGSPAYHLAKTGTDRLTKEMASELREHQVAVVSLYPGLVRTEGILKYAQYIDLSNSESPQYTGRAVAHLAGDADIMAKSGENLWVCDLAKTYGFGDVDGKVIVPDWYPA